MARYQKSRNPYENLFDMVYHLHKESSEEPFELVTKKGVAKSDSKAVQAFVSKQMQDFAMSGYSIPEVNKKIAIQAFTASTDLTKIDTNVWNAFQETPNFDMFWQEAFREVPLRRGQLEWSIGNVTSGVTFRRLPEGGKIEYAKISGTTVKGEVDLYGGGLEITWKTLEGRDLAGFYNAMMDFKNRKAKEWADVHYGLLGAAAALNQVAWQTGSTTLDRDIATLNKGYNDLGAANKDKGFGDTANARMILYVAPNLKQRLLQALRVTSADMARSGNAGQITVDSNIEIRFTFNDAIPVNKGLLVLPKNKIQNSVYMKEKSFERTNPDNLSWLKSDFTAIGAIVGDSDQCFELAFA